MLALRLTGNSIVLRTTELFLPVVAAGPYAFSVTGTDAKVVVLPYSKPKQGKLPESAPGANGILDLAKGFYRLRVKLQDLGVANLVIADAQLQGGQPRDLMSSTGAVQVVDIPEDHEAARLADAAERIGLLVRRLPSKLGTPLPLALYQGQQLTSLIELARLGVLQLITNGPRAEFELGLAGALATETSSRLIANTRSTAPSAMLCWPALS